MSEKTKTSNQRLKILYLYKILTEKTDELHPITMPEIITQLEFCGISAARKALYEDIEALKNFGLDIITLKGNPWGYYVASREFELPELKLLADAVSSSRFLTEKKSSELLKKIESLASIYEATQIHRQVYVANRVKAMNERIYINVDVIHRAIAEKKKISFRYFDYDVHKKKKYREGVRTCSPYALTWEDEMYYLVAYYDRRSTVTNLRADRMEAVEILDEAAREKPQDFVLADYMNASFSMFSGESQEVRLRFDNVLVNAVLDRFGQGITLVPDGEKHFTVRVNVKTEHPQTFFGWMFQFGTLAEIVEPCELKDKYAEYLETVLKMVSGGERAE